jgi:TatD DNase family protein
MNKAVDQARMNEEIFPRFVDAHVHLSDKEYAECIDEIIQEARMANVVALVSNSVDLETSIKSLELAEKYYGLVYAALGIQPVSVEHMAEEELERTLNLISKQKMNKAMVAIGEIGLDSNHMNTWNDQLRVFDEMLHCAERVRLPVIVHSRGTAEQVIDRLPSYNLVRVLLHFFTGPTDALSKAIEHGYYVSEGPAAVYSESIGEVVRKVPLMNLLTETDGPVRFYRPPFKGKRTTPAFIPEVVRAIAKIKEASVKSVAEKIADNFEQFFTLKLNAPR